jgi:hypothetical protein
MKHGYALSDPSRWDTSLFLKHVSMENCMQSKICRGYSRNQDVVLDDKGFLTLMQLIKGSNASTTAKDCILK